MSVEEAERNSEIWRDYVCGSSQVAIAQKYGISQQRVSQIVQAMRDALGVESRQERSAREVAFLDEVRREAMEIAHGKAAPLVAGKDGDVVRDPETQEVVRDHSGRLAAMSLAVQTSAHIRRALGLDAPVRTEITGGVRHEIVGVDPEDLQ